MPIPIDSLKKNQWVAICCCRDIAELNLWDDDYSDSWKGKNKKEITVNHPFISGEPLQIKEVSLPFISVLNPNTRRRFPLDTRIFGFTSLSDSYAKSLTKQDNEPIRIYKGQDGSVVRGVDIADHPKKEKDHCLGKCPHCGHRLRTIRKELDIPFGLQESEGREPVWVYECEECKFQGFRK